MATQHQYGEGYSGARPVPTVQGFHAQQQELEKQAAEAPTPISPTSTTVLADAETTADTDKPLPAKPPFSTPAASAVGADLPRATADDSGASQLPDAEKTQPLETSSSTKNHETKAEIMAKATANKTKPTDRIKGSKGYVARDPVTGQDVMIQNAEWPEYDNDALDSSKSKKGPASTPPDPNSKTSAFHQSPTPVKPGNISFQPYPPEISTESLKGFFSKMDQLGYTLAGGLALVWLVSAFGRGFWIFTLRSSIIGAIAIGGFSMISITRRNMEKELERIRYDLHRQRGEQFSPPTPESVEWMNALLKTVWGLINPEMFISVADMVEDVMQASLPGFIDSVKIADLGQGSNPVRVISIRGLPDQPGDKEYPREEWIDQGKPVELTDEEKKKKQEAGLEDASKEDQSGDYVNYEISLAYQAQPGQGGSKLRSSNIHLMLEFFLGVYDWIHIPIPIYAVVEGFAATARIRLQLVAEPPFIRNLTFTLMGVPKVEVSVTPLLKAFPNVLDLPLISGFVQSAIAAAANEYVAPKSMTMNLAQILMGDGVKKDTLAIGVLQIKIRYAVGLSAQDSNGKSDPYVVLAYTKLGKPLYSSRIILADLNPVFEETAFLLVTPAEVNAQEDLSLQLWDSDKRSADDLVGRVVVSLAELMKRRNEIIDRTDQLSGFQDADDMPGEIHWSIGYFEKFPLNKQLQVDPKEATPAADKLPEHKKEELAPQGTIADSKDEADSLTTPPDPSRPSGVLSVIVHHVASLERQDLKGASGNREGAAGQDTDEVTEQSQNLPSAYCEILLNDDMIYKTRTKQYTSMPFYEAGTERFIRDWTKTVVRVVVRDAKLREHDPILGIVNLPLADVLTKASVVTNSYSLVEGVGFGRANISVLFKSFKVDLPRELQGWDTGTLHIVSDITAEVDSDKVSKLEGEQLSLGSTESSAKIPGKLSSREGNKIVWQIEDSIRIPFYSRYQSAVHFNVGGKEAIGSLWLQDLADDEEKEVKIPLLVAKDAKQLRQNYISEQTAKTHEYEQIGYITCKVLLDSGLDFDHEETVQRNQTMRHNFETWEHIEGQAKRAEINSHAADDGVIDSDEKKAIKRAHTRELASRHRGAMQFQAVRTAIWMKDGLKKRTLSTKDKITGNKPRNPTIETEA